MPSDEELMQILSEPAGNVQAGAMSDDDLIAMLADDPVPQGGNAAYSALQGLTFGWGDELVAGTLATIASLAGDIPEGQDWDNAYEDIRNSINQDTEAFAARNPKTALGAEIAGGLLTGGAGLAKGSAALVKPTHSLLRKGATLAGIGATGGGVQGAGSAKEGERIEGAKKGAAVGAVAAPIGAAVIGSITRAIGNRKEIGKLLADGKIDSKTAGWMLRQNPVDNPEKLSKELVAFTGVADDIPVKPVKPVKAPGIFGVKKDRAAQDVLKQGWSDDAVSIAQGADKATKTKLRKMLDLRQRIGSQPVERVRERTSDIIGDSVMDRFDFVKKVNKRAGQGVEATADKLKGRAVNPEPVANKFLDSLEGKGVKIVREANGYPSRLDFRGSDFEDIGEAEKVLGTVFNRLVKKRVPDAYDIHRAKSFIDNNVSYDKPSTQGRKVADTLIKDLRRDLNGLIRDISPEYKKHNDVYSETIEALNDTRKIARNIEGEGASGSTGSIMRRITSNATSRTPLINSVTRLDDLSRKYGKGFDDDIDALVAFENTMNSFLGETADTAAANIVRQGAKQGIKDIAGGQASVSKVGSMMKGLTDPTINEDQAFKTMRDLLKRAE
jgi:hypothetical protein